MFFLVLISAFSFISEKKLVAIVGDTKVFEEDIPQNLTLDQYLKNLVFFELAKEKGYDDSVRTQIEQRFDQEMIKRTIGRFANSFSVPTLYESVFYYINSKKKFEIQLIQTRSFTQALKAYIEVLKGRDFGEVSAEYSFNPRLKKSKGFLDHPFSWSFVFPRAFSLIVRMKKGEISPPMQYGSTWNIIKIVSVEAQGGENLFDRQKIMEEIENPMFKRQIYRDKRSRYNFRLQKFIPWISNIKINSKGLSLLSKRISSFRGRSMGNGTPFKEADLDVVLATGTVGEYKIQDFIEDAVKARELSLFSNEDAAANFIRDNMKDRTVVAICRRLGAQREPYLSKAYEKSIKDATLDFFKRKEILAVIKENEDKLKAFYNNNKEKYEVQERRRVSLIEVREEQEAQEIREKILKGEDFGTLAQKKSMRKTSLGGGDIGYIKEDQWGAIGREAFLLQEGVISKVFKTNRGWAIIKVTGIKKKYFSGYSDVESSVRIDYKEDKAREIGNEIFNQNKEKFGLKIFN